MPFITLTFSDTVQSSVQINDIAYYVEVTEIGGFDTKNADIIRIGPITTVGINSIVVDMPNGVTPPSNYVAGTPPYHFILFSKDNEANMTGLLGYYADVKLVNDSISEGEIFSIGSDYFESSK